MCRGLFAAAVLLPNPALIQPFVMRFLAWISPAGISGAIIITMVEATMEQICFLATLVSHL